MRERVSQSQRERKCPSHRERERECQSYRERMREIYVICLPWKPNFVG